MTSTNIKKDYLTIIHEIKAYDTSLAEKEQVVVLTKCDAADEKQIINAKKELAKLKIKNVLGISAVSGDNIVTLIRTLQNFVSSNNSDESDGKEEQVQVWSP